LKKITRKLVCDYTGLLSKVTVEYQVESIRNGMKVIVPVSVKCDYRDMVSQRIAGEGFFCNCEREIKKSLEEKIT
jgi:hypothetical protein